MGILDCGFGGFRILGILEFGDFDFGFWILDRYVANFYVRPPTPQIWGFWILGVLGILDLGDFGFWILRLGG